MTSIYLNPLTWDLDVDANGNIATCESPYQVAQDVACALRTFQGECWYQTSVGVPYLSEILGLSPSLAFLKSLLEKQALTVAGVVKAQVVITSVAEGTVSGQVQITDSSGSTSSASF